MYRETLPWQANYREDEVPPYILPEVLRCRDGAIVSDPEEWRERRRPELLRLFRSVMYGELPPLPDRTCREVTGGPDLVLDGMARRWEMRIIFRQTDGRSHAMDVLLYEPTEAGRHPVFVGLTFSGNHAVEADDRIHITGLAGASTRQFSRERGALSRRFPLEMILRRNYALAVASYHDLFPDCADGWERSIYRLFCPPEELAARPKGRSAIGAWAWGISRMLDCLRDLPGIDTDRAAVYGHSRLGKTALWAGVNDERFRLLCINESGCGGAALSRRLFGETLFSMYETKDFGQYWFCDALRPYALHPETLPFDQHCLIALAAPRAVAVHSAAEDLWSDPTGEYLSAYYAGEVYRLLGREPLVDPQPPPTGIPVGNGDVGYLRRPGGHDMLAEDWAHYLDMADRIFRGGRRAMP